MYVYFIKKMFLGVCVCVCVCLSVKKFKQFSIDGNDYQPQE